MAKTFPDMSVTIRLGDLLKANEALARRVREEASRDREREREEHGDYLVAAEEARAMLGNPHPTTMWRWEGAQYLHPVRIGGRKFYRSSELERIIKGHTVKKPI